MASVSFYVLALCLIIVFVLASGSVVVDSERWYIVLSLWSLYLVIGEMRRSSEACRSTDSGDVVW